MTTTDAEIKEYIQHVFPFKKTGFRDNQESVILNIVKNYFQEKKFAILEAPTGAGKSVIAYTALKVIRQFDNGYRMVKNKEGVEENKKQYSGPHSLIAVHTRALQIQYATTFPDVPLIWSGANYPCAVEPTNDRMYWGCGECPKKRCVKYDVCDYANAQEEFLSAEMGITNYSYYLHAPFVKPFVCVIDEAHNLEDVLCDWAKVELSTKYLTDLLLRLINVGKASTGDADDIIKLVKSMIFLNDKKNGWLEELRTLAKNVSDTSSPLFLRIEAELEEHRKSFSDPKSLTKEKRIHLQFLERSHKYFRNLIRNLNPIRTLQTEWVISNRMEEENKKGKVYPKVEIKPLFINEISNTRLFKHTHFFLFMSATICGPDVFMKYLGIPKEKSVFYQLPSTFPKENRPVYSFVDIGKFTYDNRETVRPDFLKWIDKLLAGQFAGVRGIVHSVSYENADYIKANSTQIHRMEFPVSDDLLDIVNIMERRPDQVIVSPSVVEGLDLKDDLARFAIFMKVPYQSLGDKWIKARVGKDDAWYSRTAVIKIIQGSGRGTRSKDDHSTTFILDSKFLDLWKRYNEFFPEWYRESVTFIKQKTGEVVQL